MTESETTFVRNLSGQNATLTERFNAVLSENCRLHTALDKISDRLKVLLDCEDSLSTEQFDTICEMMGVVISAKYPEMEWKNKHE
jgi:hypothetical protein